jgi:hypothetical protein
MCVPGVFRGLDAHRGYKLGVVNGTPTIILQAFQTRIKMFWTPNVFAVLYPALEVWSRRRVPSIRRLISMVCV